MFRTNDMQQLRIDDAFNNLTEREKKRLNKSWAKFFGDEIFPSIDEEIFRPIYSDNERSCPNTPANINLSLSILKELFDLSDEEVVEAVLFDIRFRYAIHTTSYSEQPVNDKMLYRFRRRLYQYYLKTGIDLYKKCITDLAEKIRKLMDIDPDIRRMDSMMISSHVRRLNRFELIYRCLSDFVKYLHKTGKDELLSGLEHYYDVNDFNQVTYHNKSSSMNKKIKDLLKDAQTLLDRCEGRFDDVKEYKLFLRCIKEQTVIENNERRLKTKEDGGMNSQMLQTPVDPEATYREKAGKKYVGYAANFEETVDKNGSVITDYQVEQNIHSDSDFMKDRLNRLPDAEESKPEEPESDELNQEESTTETPGESGKITIVTDGAYASEENSELAEKKNAEIITTNLTGKETSDIMADFKMNKEGDKIEECPEGKTPIKCTSNPKYGTVTGTFDSECCAKCPHKEECRAKINKNGTARVTVSKAGQRRAKARREMKKKDFNAYYRLRNGAETIMSVMRRKYNADKIPTVGLHRVRIFIGSKVGAYNFTKFFLFRKGQLCCAQNPIFD